MSALLEISGAKVHFGGVKAVDGIDLQIEEGRLYGVVGPNGSGKTTLINAISRLYDLTAGTIRFDGSDVAGLQQHELAYAGMARTFQSIRLLPTLTVRENVLLTADRLCRANRAGGRRRGRDRAAREAADIAMERVGIGAVANVLPDALPYGTQRRVEIARALVGDPKLLLLDEPIAGMTRHERDEIAGIIAELARDGLTQMVIEHDLRTLLQICDRLIVMNFGLCVAEGPPRETAALPEVQEAYLGKRHAVA
jgi:ABC-type branched-subunit amino acid transport system ATPase component